MTTNERDYAEQLDEFMGEGEGRSLLNKDPVAFEVGMNEWLRDNNRYYNEDENEAEDNSICKHVDVLEVDWDSKGNENITASLVRKKYDELNQCIVAKREGVSELEYILENLVVLEDYRENKFPLLQFDPLIAYAEGYLGDSKTWNNHIGHIESMIENELGEEAPSLELKTFVEKISFTIEETIKEVEKQTRIDFDDREYDDSIEEFMQKYSPAMNELWEIENMPSENTLQDLLENAPNVSIVEMNENLFIAMNGGGTDLTNEIAYAYLKIDGKIPAEVGSLRMFDDGGSQKLRETLAAYMDSTIKIFTETHDDAGGSSLSFKQ
jgi:hypothetical protein